MYLQLLIRRQTKRMNDDLLLMSPSLRLKVENGPVHLSKCQRKKWAWLGERAWHDAPSPRFLRRAIHHGGASLILSTVFDGLESFNELFAMADPL